MDEHDIRRVFRVRVCPVFGLRTIGSVLVVDAPNALNYYRAIAASPRPIRSTLREHESIATFLGSFTLGRNWKARATIVTLYRTLPEQTELDGRRQDEHDLASCSH